MKTIARYLGQCVGLILCLLMGGLAHADNLAFTMQLDTGKITQIHKQTSNIVFGIDAINGVISSVYIFGSTHEADKFMDRGNPELLPTTSLSLGNHSDVKVYTDELSSLEYVKNYASHSRSGIVGAISKINEYDFAYHLKIGNNSTMGIVGFLKKVANHNISYHKNYSSNVRAGVVGKLEFIGSTKFSYHMNNWSSQHGKYAGKINKVGDIDIKIYPPYAHKQYQTGKISAIGDIEIEYYSNTRQNTSIGIAGRFKRRTGTDSRFKIWFQ